MGYGTSNLQDDPWNGCSSCFKLMHFIIFDMFLFSAAIILFDVEIVDLLAIQSLSLLSPCPSGRCLSGSSLALWHRKSQTHFVLPPSPNLKGALVPFKQKWCTLPRVCFLLGGAQEHCPPGSRTFKVSWRGWGAGEPAKAYSWARRGFRPLPPSGSPSSCTARDD